MSWSRPSLHAADPANANVVVLPVIILIGCSPSLEARCRAVGARARALVRAQVVPFSPGNVRRLRPLVLVVPARIYAAAPDDLEVLAEGAGASLVLIENEALPRPALESRVLDALTFAQRLRSQVRARHEQRRARS